MYTHICQAPPAHLERVRQPQQQRLGPVRQALQREQVHVGRQAGGGRASRCC